MARASHDVHRLEQFAQLCVAALGRATRAVYDVDLAQRVAIAADWVSADPGLDGLDVCTYYVRMVGLRFLWDDQKNLANRRKHGVSFEEARSAFLDENAKVYFDPDHSKEEDRFILLGMSLQLRVLVVCHCYRESEAVVRIISARRANRREQESYWR